jgi:hypothetical protein
MAKSKKNMLVEKSIHALISAIEIYNKPDFKYREENFAILLVNAWELLLKAKVITDNGNKQTSIYVTEYITNKHGDKSKKWNYKRTRSGNIMTIDINKCMGLIEGVDDKVKDNIETLIEIRDNAVHYYNISIDFLKTVHEVGSASIYDYMYMLKEWFNMNLNHYHLYLLPLSFFGGAEIESVPVLENEKKLLDYIESMKAKYPYYKDDRTHYSFQVQITLTKKSKGTSGLYLTNDPNATKVHLSDDQLADRYPFSYDNLWKRCEKRYKYFKRDQTFFDLKEKYENDPKYCYERYATLNNTGKPIKKYYSSSILEALDNHYELK